MRTSQRRILLVIYQGYPGIRIPVDLAGLSPLQSFVYFGKQPEYLTFHDLLRYSFVRKFGLGKAYNVFFAAIQNGKVLQSVDFESPLSNYSDQDIFYLYNRENAPTVLIPPAPLRPNLHDWLCNIITKLLFLEPFLISRRKRIFEGLIGSILGLVVGGIIIGVLVVLGEDPPLEILAPTVSIGVIFGISNKKKLLVMVKNFRVRTAKIFTPSWRLNTRTKRPRYILPKASLICSHLALWRGLLLFGALALVCVGLYFLISNRTAATQTYTAITKRVNALHLNLRTAPGTKQPIIMVLSKNTEVIPLNETTTIDRMVWIKVRVGQQEGWVSTKYLE